MRWKAEKASAECDGGPATGRRTREGKKTRRGTLLRPSRVFSSRELSRGSIGRFGAISLCIRLCCRAREGSRCLSDEENEIRRVRRFRLLSSRLLALPETPSRHLCPEFKPTTRPSSLLSPAAHLSSRTSLYALSRLSPSSFPDRPPRLVSLPLPHPPFLTPGTHTDLPRKPCVPTLSPRVSSFSLSLSLTLPFPERPQRRRKKSMTIPSSLPSVPSFPESTPTFPSELPSELAVSGQSLGLDPSLSLWGSKRRDGWVSREGGRERLREGEVEVEGVGWVEESGRELEGSSCV